MHLNKPIGMVTTKRNFMGLFLRMRGLFLIITLIVSFNALFAQTAGTLDNFADGNISASPTWNVISGVPSISAGELVFSTPSGSNGSGLNMYTNFTTPCQEWTFSIRSLTSFNADLFRYFFILKDNSDPTHIAANGYFIQYQASTGDVSLNKVESASGNQVITQLNNYDGPSTNPTIARNIKLTLSKNGNFELFVNGISRFTVSDATFKSCLTQYQSIRIIDAPATTSYTYYADNFAFVTWPCTNPENGGVIGPAQSQCTSFDPASLLETAPPQCYYGSLEYKWQQSNNGSADFQDILNENGSFFDPGVQANNKFFKRLTRVNCDVTLPWIESNVVSIYTSNIITGSPKNDTVYNQLGNALFGVEISQLSGNTFTWQVSTNNGGSWSSINASSLYSISSPVGELNRSFLQITNPTFSMNGYLYRCVITNACGTITTNTAKLFVLPEVVFSNSAPTSCGSWDGTLNKTITVSGVGTLNTSSNVLKQINVKMGKSCSPYKSFNTYDFTLISPTGVIYNFITDLTNVFGFDIITQTITSTPQRVWIDIHFRDHSSLERIRTYANNTQRTYFPYSIGYYGVDNMNTQNFQTIFDGVQANGDWIFSVNEQDAETGASFEGVELVFGSKHQVVDYTSVNANNSCLNALCIGSDSRIIIGTNDLYQPNDIHYPGNIVNGCNWNGQNNNSAWYYFWASSSTAYITVSGMQGTTNSNNDMQLVVMDGNSGCLASGWSVPAGGCSDDENYNNRDYLTSVNQGGIGTSGNIYSNGITVNTEFKLQGLIPGRRYLLMIDGNGGRSSSYYIEAVNGCQACILEGILPVKYHSFNVFRNGSSNQLIWKTAEELNNDYFQIERSADGANWISIMNIEGAGRGSRSLRAYERYDNKPLKGQNYYRIKTVSSDDKVSYSDIRTVYNSLLNELSVFPNPGSGIFTVSGLEKGVSHQIRIMDVAGKLISSANTTSDLYRFDMSDEAPGVYFIQVDGKDYLRFVNVK